MSPPLQKFALVSPDEDHEDRDDSDDHDDHNDYNDHMTFYENHFSCRSEAAPATSSSSAYQ